MEPSELSKASKERSVTKVLAKRLTPSDSSQGNDVDVVRLVFRKDGLTGKGTFGLVQRVRILKVNNVNESSVKDEKHHEETLAMKIISVRRKESRELFILRKLNHINIIKLRYFYFSSPTRAGSDQIRLNLIFDLQPTTFHEEILRRGQTDRQWAQSEVALFSHQIARGLQYLHTLHIAHRDLKPRNILYQPGTDLVQICDLGSACHVLTEAGPSTNLTAYICSRFYRAPELLLGSTQYTTAIDMWSLGCVMGELCLLSPLLEGEDAGDQLAIIVDMLGAPSEEDIESMKVEDHILASAMRVMETVSFSGKIQSLLMSYGEICQVVTSLLKYSPECRATADRVLQDPSLSSLLES